MNENTIEELRLEARTKGGRTFLQISNLELAVKRAGAVCRITCEGHTNGTGILLTGDFLLTNHHVLPNELTAGHFQTTVGFNYKIAPDGTLAEQTQFHLDPAGGFWTSPVKNGDDWTIVKLKSNSKGTPSSQFDAVELEDIAVVENDLIHIIQHRNGEPKEYSIGAILEHSPKRILYDAETEPGSSGSPVFNSRWEIVALHHAEGVSRRNPATCISEPCNEGIPVGAIIRGLTSQLNGNAWPLLRTSDVSNTITEETGPFRGAYIDPLPVFRSARLEQFEQRNWLNDRLDSFLGGHDRGYFILEAAAGLGKTAFIADLVRARKYIHLFVEQTPGLSGVPRGLRCLAAQLNKRWGVQPFESDGNRPDYLSRFLEDAARARNRQQSGERIVVVIDALDEAGVPEGENALGLPADLPVGVYVVVSHRPTPVYLRVTTPRAVVTFAAEDPANREDITRFVERALNQPEFEYMRRNGDGDREAVVQTLLDRSGGNWVYLRHALEDIGRGDLSVGTLPTGLWSYYAHFWRKQRDRDPAVWGQVGLPLLATLAAARTAVPADLLASFNECRDASVFNRELNERWRAFLAVEEVGSARRYRLNHASLREFVEGLTEPGERTEAEQVLATELAEATRAAHGRIANHYLVRWGGLDGGLSYLIRLDSFGAEDEYGLQHLTDHLERAGRAKDVHRVIFSENRVKERLAALRPWWWTRLCRALRLHDATEDVFVIRRELTWLTAWRRHGKLSGFISDLYRGKRLADLSGTGVPLLVLRCRYQLIAASLRSQAAKFSPELLTALVARGFWSSSEAFARVREIPSDYDRVSGLVRLFPVLPSPLQEQCLQDLLGGLDIVRNEGAIVKLAPQLPSQLIGMVQKALHDDSSPHKFGEASTALALRMVELDQVKAAFGLAAKVPSADQAMRKLAAKVQASGKYEEALQAVESIWSEWDRFHALHALIPDLPQELIPRALVLVDGLVDPIFRPQAAAALAPRLPLGKCDAALEKALCAAEKGRRDLRAVGLRELASQLPLYLLDRARESLTCSPDDRRQLEEYEKLMGHPPTYDILMSVPETARSAAERAFALRYMELGDPARGLQITEAIESTDERAIAMAGLAAGLTGELLDRAVKLAESLDLGWSSSAAAVLAIAERLPTEPGQQIVRNAIERAAALSWAHQRAAALIAFGRHRLNTQTETVLGSALLAVGEISDLRWKIKSLVDLLPDLKSNIRKQALEMLRRACGPDLNALTEKERTDDRFQEDVVAVLTYLAASAEYETVLQILETVDDHRIIERALVRMAPHLPPKVVGGVVQWLANSKLLAQMADAVGALLGRLPESDRQSLLPLLLRDFQHDYLSRVYLLPVLATYLEPRILAGVMDELQVIDDTWARAPVLRRLAQAFADLNLNNAAVAAANAVHDLGNSATHEWCRAVATLAAVTELPGRRQLLNRAVRAANSIPSDWLRVVAWSALAPRLGSWRSAWMLRRAARTAASITPVGHFILSLSALIPALRPPDREPWLRRLWDAVTETAGSSLWYDSANLVRAHLPSTEVANKFRSALNLAAAKSQKAWEKDRYSLLPAFEVRKISLYLVTHGYGRLVLDYVDPSSDRSWLVGINAVLALWSPVETPFLPPDPTSIQKWESVRTKMSSVGGTAGVWEPALDSAEELQDDGCRALVLAKLIPCLPEKLLSRVLEQILAITYPPEPRAGT